MSRENVTKATQNIRKCPNRSHSAEECNNWTEKPNRGFNSRQGEAEKKGKCTQRHSGETQSELQKESRVNSSEDRLSGLWTASNPHFRFKSRERTEREKGRGKLSEEPRAKNVCLPHTDTPNTDLCILQRQRKRGFDGKPINKNTSYLD